MHFTTLFECLIVENKLFPTIERTPLIRYNLCMSDSNGKVQLTPQKIIDKKFTKDVKGYEPDEVDGFLDSIINDYVAFDRYQKDAKDYIEKLELDLKNVGKRIETLELDNAKMHSRLDGIKDGDKVTMDNMAYIQRINMLERFLYAKGYNPKDLK